MSLLYLVMTDGRDELLETTIASSLTFLHGDIDHRVIHTDNGLHHRHALEKRYPDFDIIGGPRKGFAGAYHRAWSYVQSLSFDFVFSTEDDFLFFRPIELGQMTAVLNFNPNVHQLCLRRQPWNEAEKAAGGIVEMWPDEYTDCRWNEAQWLEHRLFWSTNPSLYRASLCKRGWPLGPHSERRFSDQLFADPQAVSAFWGSRHSGEWVEHIGDERAGHSY